MYYLPQFRVPLNVANFTLPTHQMRPCKLPEITKTKRPLTTRISVDNPKPITQCRQIVGPFYPLFSTACARDEGNDVLEKG